MAARPKIAVYAPLKPPDHPIASGDREIARLFIDALQHAGYDVALASRFISYQSRPDTAVFRQRHAAGCAEAERLITEWRHAGKPDLWFTYHPYCKAPDWIGPRVAETLGIPYVTAEACRTRQGNDADWEAGRLATQRAVIGAAANFCLKPSDENYLRSILPDPRTIFRMKPFLDAEKIMGIRHPAKAPTGSPPLIVSVGMMRPGAKIASYRLLAQSLFDLRSEEWQLAVIGDGPQRGEVENLLRFAGGRVNFTGALPRAETLKRMAAADLLAWPGIGEAIGMVYLEAQALGLPIAACATAGVANVVENGSTGLLAPEADAPSFTAALRSLLLDTSLRERLARERPGRVAALHDFQSAATCLRQAIDPLLDRAHPIAAQADTQ